MVTLPYGDGTLDVDLPDCDVTTADPQGAEPVDPRAAAERAVADPHGPGVRDIADPDDEVALVVTDVTRATPDDVLVEVLLEELAAAGVPRERVTVVIGLGLHRPMTDAEIRRGLGDAADLAVNHDPEATVEVGTVDDVPVEVNERVAAADLVVSTGMVEPHQYAGFSGGAKTVVVGAGSESFIRYTHGPALLGRPGVRLGAVADNPFRDAIDRAGEAVGVDFCLNVTHQHGAILGAAAGRPRSVVETLAARARDAIAVEVDGTYDAVVAGVGAPKDANLYQTTRAFTYLVLGAHNPVREGGRVVVPARLPEGAGDGTGERRFYRYLSEADDPATLYERMRDGYEPGAQRAFVVARALRDADLYVTNSEAPAVVESCLMHAAGSVPDAVEPGSDVLAVPDALNTLLL
jgi:nickel-dependent lactate racemase